jgi:hypothetical protein
MPVGSLRTSAGFPSENAFGVWMNENSTTQAEAAAMFERAQQESRDAERQAWIDKNMEKLGTGAAE